MDGFERITGREHDGLVEKCQENGWLKVGGFDWQDDPFLEEYPYEFSRTDSVDRLREALGSGNWAIRQGFCYRDLAFIQQVDGGDEWWTLKQDGESWVPFESIGFKRIAGDISELTRHVAGMRLATIDECKHLDYLPPKSDMQWVGNAFPYLDDGWVEARNCDFRIHVALNRMGKLLTVNAPSEEYMVDQAQEGMSLLDAIKSQIERAVQYKAERMTESLADRTQAALRASENQQRADRASESRETAR